VSIFFSICPMAPFVALFCGALLAVTGSLGALVSPSEAYPSPRTAPTQCHRSRPSWVCDPEEVLTPGMIDVFDGVIRSINTSCTFMCRSRRVGFQTGVAMLQEMPNTTAGPRAASRDMVAFGHTIAQHWGMDKSGCQGAVLVMPALYQRAVYWSIGPAAKRFLKFDDLRKLSRQIEALIRLARIDTAVLVALSRLRQLLCAKREIPAPRYVDAKAGPRPRSQRLVSQSGR